MPAVFEAPKHVPDLLAGFGPAAGLVNAAGRSGIVLACEHASAAVPAPLGDLGLAPSDRLSHAAWDIGAAAVARTMAARLDAVLVESRVSRLVHDCNRPAGAPDAMPAQSEVIAVPGNRGLDACDRSRRALAVHLPFHDLLAETLDARGAGGWLVTLHSFTPVWFGQARALHLGFLHGADDRLARALLAAAGSPEGEAALNQPYGPADGVLYTLDRHAAPRGWPAVMIEIRNDLILTAEAQAAMAARLCRLLDAARASLGETGLGGAGGDRGGR